MILSNYASSYLLRTSRSAFWGSLGRHPQVFSLFAQRKICVRCDKKCLTIKEKFFGAKEDPSITHIDRSKENALAATEKTDAWRWYQTAVRVAKKLKQRDENVGSHELRKLAIIALEIQGKFSENL